MSTRRTTLLAALVMVCGASALAAPTTAYGRPAGHHISTDRAPGLHNGRIFFSTGYLFPDPDPAGATPQVYSVRPDGSGLRALTHVSDDATAGDPSASPDGRTIAYVSNEDGDFALRTMTRTGRHQHTILATSGVDYFTPSWAPDGTRLVVSACDNSFGFDAWCDLVTVDAHGGDLRTVVADTRYNLGGDYSPDGRRIEFQSDRRGLVGAIWVVAATGGRPHRVTPAALEAFVGEWSPDGRHIVFADNCCQLHSNVWVVSPSGHHLRQLTHVPFGHDAAFPSYSPDGRQIVVAGNALRPRFSPKSDLFTMRTDGTHVRRIVSSTQPAVQSSWSRVPAPAPMKGVAR
jgi:Tol biopolymer transport system component